MIRATTLTVLAALAASASLNAQATPAVQPATRGIGRYTAIGCVSRQGTAAAPRYTVTDTRGDRPTVYRLDGDAALLARHVGHTVEVAGPLGRPQAGTAQSALKVNSLVWLSSSCRDAAR